VSAKHTPQSPSPRKQERDTQKERRTENNSALTNETNQRKVKDKTKK